MNLILSFFLCAAIIVVNGLEIQHGGTYRIRQPYTDKYITATKVGYSPSKGSWVGKIVVGNQSDLIEDQVWDFIQFKKGMFWILSRAYPLNELTMTKRAVGVDGKNSKDPHRTNYSNLPKKNLVSFTEIRPWLFRIKSITLNETLRIHCNTLTFATIVSDQCDEPKGHNDEWEIQEIKEDYLYTNLFNYSNE